MVAGHPRVALPHRVLLSNLVVLLALEIDLGREVAVVRVPHLHMDMGGPGDAEDLVQARDDSLEQVGAVPAGLDLSEVSEVPVELILPWPLRVLIAAVRIC